MTAFLFLADGFEEIEALGTVDILRRAEINISTVSVTKNIKVKGRSKIEVMADALFEDIDMDGADILILPGGAGVSILDIHEDLKNMIKKHNDKNKWIAAICAAPTILGGMGLLEAKGAVCYPGCEGDLKGAVLKEEEVIVDGHIITSKGPGTTFLFALKIIEMLKGIKKAKEVAKDMCYSL
ncbi:MAG: DJ-1/PfpI family protein [Epulopiscium sp.]|nr:DJ-1/PfpI family protein [Candidatus Epulonipiscium sp.]